MQDFNGVRILLGVSGGIAAYKSAYLVRELKALGADVQVVMTASATQFISPLTMQALSGREVRRTLFDEAAEAAMGHIELARWADICIIAPATANIIAKFAQGVADDLLSTLVLALKVPLIVCPAMNQTMWHHKATQANIEQLKQRGVQIVGPGTGLQACGDEGLGRMVESEMILNAVRLQPIHQVLSGRRVLITAGPTREMIDPVRFVSNRSSGKMGFALAHAAYTAGAEVILVSGPSALSPPEGIQYHVVASADEMHNIVMSELRSDDIFIGAAAVCDYKPHAIQEAKIKKQSHEGLSLQFKQNIDILASVAASKKAAFVMGFAAETHDVIQHAREKLVRKQVDCIVANLVSETKGFDVDNHEVTIVTSDEERVLPQMHKVRLAGELVAFLASNLQNDKHVFDGTWCAYETDYTT